MFDSENVSLVTRIEAGDGVTVTHSTNLEGENIWTAAVDEAWLTAWVNANSSGALKLNDSDSLRIKALENALGINANSTVAAPAVVAGTEGTTQITIAADVAVLSGPLTMSYNIRGIDNTVLVTETMTVAAGSSPAAILMTMYAQMRANTNMTKFMAPTYVSGDNMLVLTWNTANVGSTFSYSITTQTSGDNVVLTATDY